MAMLTPDASLMQSLHAILAELRTMNAFQREQARERI